MFTPTNIETDVSTTSQTGGNTTSQTDGNTTSQTGGNTTSQTGGNALNMGLLSAARPFRRALRPAFRLALRPAKSPVKSYPLHTAWQKSIVPVLWWENILPLLGDGWVQKVYEQAILSGDRNLMFLMVNLFGNGVNYSISIRPLFPWIRRGCRGFRVYPADWYAPSGATYKYPPDSVTKQLHKFASLGLGKQFIGLCEMALGEAGGDLYPILFPSHLLWPDQNSLISYMSSGSMFMNAIRGGNLDILRYMLGQLPALQCYVINALTPNRT